MGKFKIGDRARQVYSEKFPEIVGHTCTIVGVGVKTVEGEECDYAVRYDKYPDHPVSGHWCCNEYNLEPILDTGEELGSWEEIESSIGWNPTKEKTGVAG
jgi:hypothetical protein